MAWAKLHTDILGDPKLMRAARKGHKSLELLPWFIAFAKQADDGGRLTIGTEPADPEDIANLIPGGTAKAVRAGLASLEAIGVLLRDGDALCFAQWDARAETKPSDSASAVAERVRRHRERQRNAQSETPGNALHETRDNATEKRRGEKEERRGARNGVTAAAPPWVATVRQRWVERVGEVSADAVLAQLGAAEALHGEAKLLPAIDAYADARIAANKPPKLAWFAEEAAVWIERAAPLVDADGVLTERGMAVAGGAR